MRDGFVLQHNGTDIGGIGYQYQDYKAIVEISKDGQSLNGAQPKQPVTSVSSIMRGTLQLLLGPFPTNHRRTDHHNG